MRMGTLAAVCLALALVTVEGANARSMDWVWTKKQAAWWIGGNIGIATACRPMGTVYRKGGINYYYRFSCGMVFDDGSQYAVTIKPTGAKTFKRLTVRKIRAADPVAPVAPVVPITPITPITPVTPIAPIGGSSSKLAGCYYYGKRLSGRVQVVDYLPDFRVQTVDYLPDLRVLQKNYLPTSCGEWQFVDYLPDFKIQFVDYLPDFRIQFVSYLPGLP